MESHLSSTQLVVLTRRGIYCKRALEQFANVELIDPSQLESIRSDQFSLYINIDEGMRYQLPSKLRPCVWWAIDTHVDYPWYRRKSPEILTWSSLRNWTALLNSNMKV